MFIPNNAYALTNISACQDLDIPGETYVLINDIGGIVGDCFRIVANNITLDLNGYKLSGAGANYAIYQVHPIVFNNITVKNGTIEQFPRAVYFRNVQGGLIEDITITDCGMGISLNNSANITVRNNNIDNSAISGFWIESGASNNTIENNIVTNSDNDGFFIHTAGSGNVFTGNQSNFNSRGFWIYNSSGNTFTNNIANNNDPGDGFYFTGSDSNTITGNTANNNTGAGFGFGSSDSNNFVNNIANNNNYGARFVFGSSNNSLDGNNLCNNGQDASCSVDQASFNNNLCDSGNVCGGVCLPCAAPINPPTVVTNNATNVLINSATLNGNITNTGGENASERGFDWGTSSGVYTNNWTQAGSYGTGAFNRGITGLTPSTTYYFRAKARNSAGWGYGAELSFTTNAVPVSLLTVVTNPANNITDTSATLNGSITDTGGENASERGFDWGTSSGVYTNNWTSAGSYGIGAFNRGIAGLTPSTTYYFRAKARNSAGWAYGAELSFTTNAAAPVFQDIGLRVRNGSGVTVSIAAEIGVATSPLRIAKNGTVYGIALVNPGDVNDSGVRIQTANDGLKALRRL